MDSTYPHSTNLQSGASVRYGASLAARLEAEIKADVVCLLQSPCFVMETDWLCPWARHSTFCVSVSLLVKWQIIIVLLFQDCWRESVRAQQGGFLLRKHSMSAFLLLVCLPRGMAWSILVSRPGSNPCPLHWEHGAVTTEP